MEIADGITAFTRWVCFAFNSEEDLVLMTHDGRLFIIDVVLGQIKSKASLFDMQEYGSKSNVAGAMLESNHNTLVMYTDEYKFFYVTGVVHSSHSLGSPIQFISSPELEANASRDHKL